MSVDWLKAVTLSSFCCRSIGYAEMVSLKMSRQNTQRGWGTQKAEIGSGLGRVLDGETEHEDVCTLPVSKLIDFRYVQRNPLYHRTG